MAVVEIMGFGSSREEGGGRNDRQNSTTVLPFLYLALLPSLIRLLHFHPSIFQEKRLDLKGNRVLDAVWDYPDGTFQKEFEFRGRDSLSNWVC